MHFLRNLRCTMPISSVSLPSEHSRSTLVDKMLYRVCLIRWGNEWMEEDHMIHHTTGHVTYLRTNASTEFCARSLAPISAIIWGLLAWYMCMATMKESETRDRTCITLSLSSSFSQQVHVAYPCRSVGQTLPKCEGALLQSITNSTTTTTTTKITTTKITTTTLANTHTCMCKQLSLHMAA